MYVHHDSHSYSVCACERVSAVCVGGRESLCVCVCVYVCMRVSGYVHVRVYVYMCAGV